MKIIAFDLDGTLIDSLGVTLEMMGDVLSSALNRVVGPDEIISHFGHPEEVIFKRFSADHGPLMGAYLKRLQHRSHDIHFFDGMREVLHELKNQGASLALYTARGREATTLILKAHGYFDFFDTLLTGSDLFNGKPHPEGLLKILTALNGKPSEMVYVGDSPKDIAMAHAAGVVSVGVTWCAHCSIADLKAEEPTYIATHPEELRHILSLLARAAEVHRS